MLLNMFLLCISSNDTFPTAMHVAAAVGKINFIAILFVLICD